MLKFVRLIAFMFQHCLHVCMYFTYTTLCYTHNLQCICGYMVMKIEITCLNVGVKALVANIYSLNCATDIFNKYVCVCMCMRRCLRARTRNFMTSQMVEKRASNGHNCLDMLGIIICQAISQFFNSNILLQRL